MKIWKPKTIIIIVITIFLIAMIIISSNPDSGVLKAGSGINSIFIPFQKISLYISNSITEVKAYFKNVEDTRKENEELKKKISVLENNTRELIEYKQKIVDLREALNIKERSDDYQQLGANIIAKDSGNWFKMFTVDRGYRDGVEENFPVTTNKGLVGRVVSAGIISSKVISIIDKDSSISARVSKTRDLVVVKGDLSLKDEGYCRMDYIPDDIELSYDDTVETSGIGGVFPKGIIIGKVKKVMQSKNEFTKYAIIEPVVDFKRLEEVFILKKGKY